MQNKNSQENSRKILRILKKEYPDVKPQLAFINAFELLIATILSAQCTDERVNIVTKELFKKFKSPADYANISTKKLEKYIFSTGFYKQKAKNIKNCCKLLIEKHGSRIPKDFDELTKLPGVGRKTASVVLGNAYNIPAIAVDTHVKRLSNLLGFVKTENPDKIEVELKELVPRKDWTSLTHWLIMHGRKICVARRPKCSECKINHLCPSSKLK